MKEIILSTVADLVKDFMYYGRMEDEELSVEQLQEALNNGTITIEEIEAQFSESLRSYLSD